MGTISFFKFLSYSRRFDNTVTAILEQFETVKNISPVVSYATLPTIYDIFDIQNCCWHRPIRQEYLFPFETMYLELWEGTVPSREPDRSCAASQTRGPFPLALKKSRTPETTYQETFGTNLHWQE